MDSTTVVFFFFFFISCISVICSYRTFPNLIIIYMCIPELFYNILLLCVNIRLFRSVKNRSSPDLIDTQSCTGSWTLVVQKNMKCSIGFLKISPVHCKLLRHGENKPNKACDWLFRTHLPASLLRLTFLFLRCRCNFSFVSQSRFRLIQRTKQK